MDERGGKAELMVVQLRLEYNVAGKGETMRILKIAGASLIIGIGALSTGCATISEEDCLAGNWADRGFKDGKSGTSRDRIADYSEACAKFGASPDRATYLANFERGLLRYCTYDKGYDRGEAGRGYNEVCSGALADDFSAGYEEGRAVYAIYKEHKSLISSYEETLDDLLVVRDKLSAPDIDPKELRRLEKKELRLEDRRESYRRDIRRFEREHGLDRYDFE